MHRFIFCALLATHFLILPQLAAEDEFQQNWPQFRGPLATGVAPLAEPPTDFSETQNLNWKTPLVGEGISTPIVWNDRVFVTAALKTDRQGKPAVAAKSPPNNPFKIEPATNFYQFLVICLERNSGKILWKEVAAEVVPSEGHHADNTYASATPCTDGKRLYVPFGSAGFYCYDFQGNQLWQRDLGVVTTRLNFGEGSSLALSDEYLAICRDNDDQSYVTVLNAADGTTIWRADRDEPSAWATPLIVSHAGRKQLITSASNRVRSYDLETGELIWECGGQVSNVTPAPLAFGDTVICMSGYRGNIVQTISLDAKGDVTEGKEVLWTHNRGTPYVPSPLLIDHRLYFTQTNNGILTCLDVRTGDALIERTRLNKITNMYASPVAANLRIYFCSREGNILVISAGDAYEELGSNQIDGRIDASPAIAGRQIFIRSDTHLYCFEQD